MLRALTIFAAAAVALSVAWSYRAHFTTAIAPAPSPKPIVFDNGTVRDSPTYRQLQAHEAPGGLRKCIRRNGEVTYSNMPCEAGQRTAPLSGGDRYSVVEVPKPAASTPAQQRLHQALDLNRDPQLRERMMDRAINGPR